MKKPYHLVVFDWEGTLGEDTLGQVLNALILQARRLNYGEIDKHIARQYVSLGLVRAVNKLFPQLTLHEHEQLLSAVQASLEMPSTSVCLLPGAKAIVKLMHENGYDLAIATNKGPQALQRVLQNAQLENYFQVTRAAGMVPAKPCPQMLEEIMAVFGVDATETLMIGDSVTDIEMASSIGVDAIGVDFYHLHAIELRNAGALEVFDDFQHVAQYLELLKGGSDEHIDWVT